MRTESVQIPLELFDAFNLPDPYSSLDHSKRLLRESARPTVPLLGANLPMTKDKSRLALYQSNSYITFNLSCMSKYHLEYIHINQSSRPQ